MLNTPFQLERNDYGQLVFISENGQRHSGITPVRAFPIAAPEEGLSIINEEGHEVAWVDHLSQLPADIRDLLEAELACREFVPEIEHIHTVSSFACPSTWELRTNRGDTTLTLKGEEDIRRLSHTCLLIADTHGIQFLVRDLNNLDQHSRKLLDRFL